MTFRKSMLALLACLFGFAASAVSASAAVGIRIDLTTQRMEVTSDSGEKLNWPISSGRSGFHTPRGEFAPYSLRRMHYSRKYQMSPMPHSIFFLGGYAIHGTGSVRQLGRPASHGCILLAPANAAKLFAMVQKQGARISIVGAPPSQNIATRGSRAKKTQVALAHRQKQQARAVAAGQADANPMAYAPGKRSRSMGAWQANPVERTYPGY